MHTEAPIQRQGQVPRSKLKEAERGPINMQDGHLVACAAGTQSDSPGASNRTKVHRVGEERGWR